jgi:hypothetical protein
VPKYTTDSPKQQINTIELDYSSPSTGTDFGKVNSGDVTVTLTRKKSSGKDREKINVTSGGSSFGGETALIDLSGNFDTNVVDDPNGNPNIKVAVSNVTNPPKKGTFPVTIKFNLSDNTTDSFDANLDIVNTQFFDVVITSAPSEVFEGDTFDIDYDVTNTGTKNGTQDIELVIDGVRPPEQTNRSVALKPNKTLSSTFTLNESDLSHSHPRTI